MNSTEEYLDKLLESVTSGEPIPEPEETEPETVEQESISPEEELSLDDLSLDDLPLEPLNELSDEDGTVTSDEDGLLEDEDISNLLKSIEEMGSPAEEIQEKELEEPEEPEEMSLDAGDDIDDIIETDDANDIDDINEIDDVNEIDDDEEILDEAIADEEDADEDSPISDDADLADLLAGMSDDEELSEINDLLSKNDNNEIVDTDDAPERELSEEELFDIDEPLSDEDEEEGAGKKGKKKKAKKAKKEKKPGFFSKLFSSLTEEVEEPEDVKQIFAEETALDIAQEGAADNEKILDEIRDEDEPEKKGKKGKKGKKEKKPKKEKKVKEKKEEEPGPPQKKLPKKKVILIGVFCFSLGVMMTLLAFLYPYYADMKNAQMEFEHQNYEQTFELLKGHRLNEEQQLMYDKSVVLLKAERKYDSYKNYMLLNMKVEALNALVQGIRVTEELSETASTLGVTAEFETIRNEIAEELQNTFAVSLDTAHEWLQLEDGQAYSRALDSYINGDPAGKEPGNLVIQGEQPDNPIIAGEEEEFADDSND